jgi:hypothetical protein
VAARSFTTLQCGYAGREHNGLWNETNASASNFFEKNCRYRDNRISIGSLKLCYVICANRMIRYKNGNSRIVYIGTTKNGIARVAPSAAYRATVILQEHGINSLEIRIVTCGVRRRVRTWFKLERALLLRFKERYGDVPRCNVQGKHFVETNEFDLFARKRVDDILKNLETGIVPDRIVS